MELTIGEIIGIVLLVILFLFTCFRVVKVLIRFFKNLE